MTLAATHLEVNRSLHLNRIGQPAEPKTHRARPARWRLGCVGTIGLLGLAACTPRFDWRDYRAPEGIIATFPGAVQSVERPIDLDGLHVRMSMHAARVSDIAFVVGAVTLTDSNLETLQKAQAAMAQGLIRNIAGVVQRDEPVKLAEIQGVAPDIPARALDVTGTAAGHAVRLQARLESRGQRVYQILVVGPAPELAEPASREALDTFFTSVRLE